tara:strand:- start:528 stop:2489 length:1962 start_codon:yes stop_codon:yes gene_type:complete
MDSIFGEQQNDFERAISQYSNNATSVAQGALGGYASVAAGRQSLAEAGETAKSAIDLGELQSQLGEQTTKFMKEMGLDFSTGPTLEGASKLLSYTGSKLTQYANKTSLPMAESKGPSDMSPIGVGKKGMRSEVDPETGKPIDPYEPGRIRSANDTNPGDVAPPPEGGGDVGGTGGVGGPPDVIGQPVGDLPPVRDGAPPADAPDVVAQPVGGSAPPADDPEPVEVDPGSIPKAGPTDPAPQAGTMPEQMTEQFSRLRQGDMPTAGEQMNAINEGRVARTPNQIDEYNAKVQDYNTRNNPLSEEPPAPEPDVPAGTPTPAGQLGPEPDLLPPRPQARQAEVPEDADFGDTPGWQMSESAENYQSSTQMTGPTDEPDTFTTTQVTQPGDVVGPEFGSSETAFNDAVGNFTGTTRSTTGTTITQKDAKPTDDDAPGGATDVQGGTEGGYTMPTTEWQGPIPPPARSAQGPTGPEPGQAPPGQAPDPAGGPSSTVNDMQKTISQESATAGEDASRLSSQAGNISSEVSSEVKQIVPEVSEETSSIASSLADMGGSMLSGIGGFLGDLMPFIAPIMAGYGMYSGLKDMNKAYGDEGNDPYAAVRSTLAAGQDKVSNMGAQISADQFASKVGGAAPAFGSLAAPTFSTAQQLGGATGHF